MILLVDIGNSRIKWTTIKSKVMSDSENFPRNKTGIKMTLTKAWKHLEGISGVFVSNVAGEKTAVQLTEWVEKNWQITPVFVESEKKRFGVTNAYEHPKNLGVDRWLAIIAARQHAKTVTCVIDCGTAITIDILTEKGIHQGGLILPGLSIIKQSLADNTHAPIDRVEENEFTFLAINTHSAVQAGTLYAVTATLEHLITDIQQNFNNQVRFLITGGDAEQLIEFLPQPLTHEPDLVLKGLALYARQSHRHKQNKAKAKSKTDTTETTASEVTALPENAN